jgi:hypothetical protein
MYKTKINRWSLQKNMKTTDLEQLARRIQDCFNNGRPMPLLRLGGKPISVDRLRRSLKDKDMLHTLCPCLLTKDLFRHHPASHGALVDGTELPHPVRSVERLFFVHHHLPELCLSQTKALMEWFFAFDGPALHKFMTFEQQDHVNYARELHKKLTLGSDLISCGRTKRGWPAIQEACDLFYQVPEAFQPELLRRLFAVFQRPSWDSEQMHELKTQLLRYFTKFAIQRFGCRHPFSVLMFHFLEDNILKEAVGPISRLMIDLSESDDESNEELWRLKRGYISLLILRGEHVTAESCARRDLKKCEAVFGESHRQTCNLLYRLAEIHRQNKELTLAEAEFEALLRRRKSSRENDLMDLRVYAQKGLAQICEARGNTRASMEHWRVALVDCLEQWGKEDEGTARLQSEIELSLSNQGIDAAAWLHNEFGIAADACI